MEHDSAPTDPLANGHVWDTEQTFLRHLEVVERATRLAGGSASYGLVLVNIVGLRHINREASREAGDAVLATVARRLHRTVPTGTSTGRVGPSELAVLVAELPLSDVTQLARRIRQTCTDPVEIDGRSVSIELQVTPRGGPNPDVGNALWAARNDARRERLRPLLHRVEHLEALMDSSVEGADAEIRDLTRRLSDAEDRARQDGLTGALNRIGAERMLTSIPVPFALAFVDLDDLRAFNALPDNHHAGDEALRAVAQLLRGIHPDGHVGRWGGDEFVVAVSGWTADQLADQLDSLLRDEHHRREAGGRRVTFSAGVADARDAGDRVGARQRAQALLRHIKDHDLKPAVLGTIPR